MNKHLLLTVIVVLCVAKDKVPLVPEGHMFIAIKNKGLRAP
jgi:hypothetical protein